MLSATAFMTGRERSPVRLLAVAVLGLVLVDPLLVWSVGFWLSVGATAGVCALGPPLARRFERLGPLAVPLGITLGAQLGVVRAERARVRPAAARQRAGQPAGGPGGRARSCSTACRRRSWPGCVPSTGAGGDVSGVRRDTKWVDTVAQCSALGSNRSRRGCGSDGRSLVAVLAVACRGRRRDPVRIEVAMTTHLLTGDDESILRTAVVELVDRTGRRR